MTLELDDIQGNVLRGYAMDHSLHVFVEVEDARAGCALLTALLEHVTTSAARPPDATLNLALSHEGLRRLGLDEQTLESFPPEFVEGMRARARDVLGDRDDSDPDGWERRLDPQLLVLLHARSRDALEARRAALADALATTADGVRIVAEQEAETRDSREHFGFRDGFGQPAVAGAPGAGRPAGGHPGEGVPLSGGRWRELRAGEFVLGYEDEDGVRAGAPADALRRNGTFMVWRKLRQDVEAFEELLRAGAAAGLGTEEDVAAKIGGRRRDGTPLLGTAPLGGTHTRATLNDFGYAGDPRGFTCPLGAHIRRANPRDGLFGGGERSKRHRIVRRGMPYRAGAERGLVFVCFNASIARQFEVVQGWLNDGDIFHLGAEHELISGSPGELAPGTMTVQGEPPVYLRPPRPLTVTRGGGYLFYPGIRALRALAA